MKNANPVSWLGRWVLMLAVALALTGCGQAQPEAAAAPKTVADYFPVKLGDKTVQLQFAVTNLEMQRGLMERRDLKPEQGMIFVYPQGQSLSFWMRNTPTPLDIGFFTADGELKEIYPLHPFDETSVSSRRKDLQFAVEMNQGWFKANSVKPGDKIDLAAIAAALKARGLPPRAFGLPN
ncbi:MAG TPA: DUF192 domain-containing protein [Opitutaceae bacterium]